MATSVKGILKGLRYISQIFDEKEPEMQIGLPTDVKHVAHIGWDGPSANHGTPSWMNEFKCTPEISSEVINTIGNIDHSSANLPAQGAEESKIQKSNRAPRSRRQPSTDSTSSLDSSVRRGSEKSSRRHRSTGPSGDSISHDSSGGSSRSSRHRRSSEQGSETGLEGSPAIPKHSHRRKSRESSDGGSTRSTRSSRSKGQNSLTDIPLPIQEVDEEKG